MSVENNYNSKFGIMRDAGISFVKQNNPAMYFSLWDEDVKRV